MREFNVVKGRCSVIIACGCPDGRCRDEFLYTRTITVKVPTRYLGAHPKAYYVDTSIMELRLANRLYLILVTY